MLLAECDSYNTKIDSVAIVAQTSARRALRSEHGLASERG